MQHDVFHHHDRVVDHQTDRRRKTAQRHQIETFSQKLEHDEGHKNRYRNHKPSHYRTAPVAQKHDEDNRGEDKPQKNRVTHALDGILDDARLVVKRCEMNSGRKRAPNAVNLRMDFVRDNHRVAVRLAIDVQEHRWFPIGAHNGIDRLDRLLHGGDIANADR